MCDSSYPMTIKAITSCCNLARHLLDDGMCLRCSRNYAYRYSAPDWSQSIPSFVRLYGIRHIRLHLWLRRHICDTRQCCWEYTSHNLKRKYILIYNESASFKWHIGQVRLGFYVTFFSFCNTYVRRNFKTIDRFKSKVHVNWISQQPSAWWARIAHDDNFRRARMCQLHTSCASNVISIPLMLLTYSHLRQYCSITSTL